MKVISFRPYKKWEDEELITKTFEVYQCLRSEGDNYEHDLQICNEFIKEAKHRRLRCSKEMMYRHIIFK